MRANDRPQKTGDRPTSWFENPRALRIGIPAWLILFLYNTIKVVGPHTNPSTWTQYLWMVSYRYGFIRRGLLGTIFQWFAGDLSYQQHRIAIKWAYLGLLCITFLLLAMVFIHLVRSSQSRSYYIMIFLFLGFSPFWPTLAYNIGQVDLVSFLFVIIGLIFILKNLVIPLAILAIMSGLLHEALIFFWIPLLMFAFISWCITQDRKSLLALALSGTLLVLAILATRILHNDNALKLILAEIGFPESDRGVLYRLQFGQSLRGMWRVMHGKLCAFPMAFWVSALYILPIPLTVAAYLTIRLRNLRWRWAPLAMTLAPMTVILIAWDLSRLQTYATAGCYMALFLTIHLEKHLPMQLPTVSRRAYRSLLVMICWAIINYVPAGLNYIYFENAHTACAWCLPLFDHLPAARFASWVAGQINGYAGP